MTGGYIVVQPTSRWFFKCWSEKKDGRHPLRMAGQWSPIGNHLRPRLPGKSHRGAHSVTLLAAECDFTGRAVDAAPIGCSDRPCKTVCRRRLSANAHGCCVKNTVHHAVRPIKTDLLEAMAQVIGHVIWAEEFGELPDPDTINTSTKERYLDLIPIDAVIATARSQLV